jgi:hypothetical protein
MGQQRCFDRRRLVCDLHVPLQLVEIFRRGGLRLLLVRALGLQVARRELDRETRG